MASDRSADDSMTGLLREHVIDELVVFSRVLRDAGVAVPTNATINAARAVATVGFGEKATVRAALRSVLVTREEDIEPFDRLFETFWRRLSVGSGMDESDDSADDILGGAIPGVEESSGSGSPVNGSDGERDEVESMGSLDGRVASDRDEDGVVGESVQTSVYSPTGESGMVSVGPRQLVQDDAVVRAVGELSRAIAMKQGRRWTGGAHERIDTRKALRQSVGTGGAVISLPGQERDQTVVQACVLVDVSQSVLDTIDRGFLVQFLRAVSASWRRVRIFFFDTSVREVTSSFNEQTPRSVVDALQQAETEWGGGTRIGNAVRSVQRDSPDAVDRDTVVFVISDGLEVGELDVLESGMSWLSRRAAAVLWLNPLANSAEYEPTCRGMETALPFVDGVFAFTNVSDIEEVARQIERHGLSGPVGYEYDPRRVTRKSP